MTISLMLENRLDTWKVLEAREQWEGLVQLLSTLLVREAYIIIERYGIVGERKTLAEVGKRLGITIERVRQMQMKAIRKLRDKREVFEAYGIIK